MATKDELEKENAELKDKIGGLERELEDALESATSGGGSELAAAQELIKELEAQLEATDANGGDALVQENAELKAENAKLQAALEGSSAKDGGKEARGESMPDFLKPDYTGPVDVHKAEKIAAHRKAEADKDKGKK
jgi:regulator of replication initiation timing